MKILLVEDELRLAEALVQILKKQNYQVDSTSDGIDGQALAESGIYDVIILDRMLPGKEGVEILRYLRVIGIATPVILLTAKDALTNKIEGLDAGADDYLTKPFSKDELLARIRALGRRSVNMVSNQKVSVGTLQLDVKNCQATYMEQKVKLTLKEAQLLEFLIRNQGQVLSKELIFDRVWGFDKDVVLEGVELYIYYLRKKINFYECDVALNTIRGVGYCLKEISYD